MDRSKISAAVADVKFVRDASGCADADLVIIDLARFGSDVAAVRTLVPSARLVCFGPHVDETGAQAACDAGADVVLPRSKFFADPSAATSE